jgi:hypothetical protein
MSKAMCINGFSVGVHDDDGFTVENEDFLVDEFTIWDIEDDDFRLIGGDVRLTNDSNEWIEIPKKMFKECFETID